jgi:protein-L-isoaspartate(D-aspartate) O-methyltransferase
MKSLEELIVSMEQNGFLKNPLLKRAFFAVDRINFVLPRYRSQSYENRPLPIDKDQTISQPQTVAFMLELLDPLPGYKILDVGSGSGWTSALLAEIITCTGQVYAIERIKSIKEFGENNAKKRGYTNIFFLEGNGALGWPDYAPFDRILVNAAAQDVPNPLKDQLKQGGKLVIPLKDNTHTSICLLEKKTEEEFKEQLFPGFSFVPFIDEI